MNYKWLNRKNNKKVIVFFNGWGMDENVINLNFLDYDFLMFYEYLDEKIDKNLVFELEKYESSIIISWSMGVIFSTLLKLNNMEQRIAINGTVKVINNDFGINEKIFNNTLQNLNINTIDMFFKNMSINDDFKKPKRNIKSQINELKFIGEFYKKNDFKGKFNKVFIGKYDKIIPFKKQKNFWENESPVVLEAGHYIFNLFKSWEEIICYDK